MRASLRRDSLKYKQGTLSWLSLARQIKNPSVILLGDTDNMCYLNWGMTAFNNVVSLEITFLRRLLTS